MTCAALFNKMCNLSNLFRRDTIKALMANKHSLQFGFKAIIHKAAVSV